jgi:hypothetical protein
LVTQQALEILGCSEGSDNLVERLLLARSKPANRLDQKELVRLRQQFFAGDSLTERLEVCRAEMGVGGSLVDNCPSLLALPYMFRLKMEK